MVKLSEIEKLTGTVGKRSVAQPLTIVSPTRMNHGAATGVAISPPIDATITATPPAMVADKYAAFQERPVVIAFKNPAIASGRSPDPQPVAIESAFSMAVLSARDRRVVRSAAIADLAAADRRRSQSPRGADPRISRRGRTLPARFLPSARQACAARRCRERCRSSRALRSAAHR